MRTEDQIFRQGSTTYYWSSKFFSKKTKQDVLKLYSYVRIADDFVDSTPQDIKSFKKLKRLSKAKKLPKKTNDEITLAAKNIQQLSKKYPFNAKWLTAFLASMEMDTKQTKYRKLDDTLTYIYGSAEVIGLMMLAILRPDLQEPERATVQGYAQLQGRAMQYINFIRDINEDITLGRCYFPRRQFTKHGLAELNEKAAYRSPAAFREFIEEQLQLYSQWQTEASNGFKYIPWRERIALRTAVDMYNWTAKKIADDPFIVFEKKVKPSKLRVILRALLRCIYA